MMLTEQQRAIADLMLVGSTVASTAQRLGVSQASVQRELAAMRAMFGADTHNQLMGELRRATRQPLKQALEMCRREPRQWFLI